MIEPAMGGKEKVLTYAGRNGRGFKTVGDDVQALPVCGALDKTSDGKIEFLSDAVRVVFLLRAA